MSSEFRPPPPTPMTARSLPSVVCVTAQPPLTSPIDVLRGDAHAREEHLVEVGDAGDLAQRPHVDAGRLHVDDEVRDAAVLRLLGIGARDQDPPVGVLRVRVPHLLPVDDPLVAVAHRTRAERGEVGAGTGLAEQLAPQLVAAQHRVEVALLLLGRAVHHERGRDHADPDGEHAGLHVELRLFLRVDRLLDAGAAAAAELLGPRDAGPPVVVQHVLPLAAALEVVVHPVRVVTIQLVDARDTGRLVLRVLFEERARFGAERGFLGRVADVHQALVVRPPAASTRRTSGIRRSVRVW